MNNRMYYSTEAEQRAQWERAGLALASMILGVGIGAVLALLFAQQTGEEARRNINKQFDESRERADEFMDDAREHSEKLRSKMEDRIHAMRG